MSRPITHGLVSMLREVPDFRDLDAEMLLHVVGASANLIWREGETIFEAGQPAEALYVVLDGRVRITDSDDEHVGELAAGEYFGEQSLLLHTKHSRRAEAVADCELMVIPRDRFQALLDAEPELAREFRGTLEARIRERTPPT